MARIVLICLSLLGTLTIVVSAPFRKYKLSGGWRICSELQGSCVPATVPGHAILDIYDGEPYFGFAETDLQLVSQDSYRYQRLLPPLRSLIDDAQFAQIVFNGLDTVASVRCNDHQLFTTDGHLLVKNAFTQHIFPIPEACIGNESVTLTVDFISALEFARLMASIEFQDKSYPHTVNYHVWSEPTHRNLLRKPASDFGWDWGPSFPGPGIIKSVFLEIGMLDGATLDEHSVVVGQDFNSDGSVAVHFQITLRRFATELRQCHSICVHLEDCALQCRDVCESDARSIFIFTLQKPKLWHPKGSSRFVYPPFLYRLVVELNSKQKIERKIGIRKISLLQNEHGVFHFLVNGELVDWRGMNVIPFDSFQQRVDWKKVEMIISKYSTFMGFNAFRIWGGGAFPPRSFYEICDKFGILLWQDLPWACAVFPATEKFLREAARETYEIVARMNTHPSIVVWGGNNEVEASFDWFPETSGSERKNYRKDYEDLFLGGVKAAVASGTFNTGIYIDSSPTNGLFANGTKRWGNPNNPRHGDVHFYNYEMNCENWDEYPRALFVSEHGVQSLPSNLERFSTPTTLDAVLDQRQRHEFGFSQMQRQASRMFSGALKSALKDIPYHNRAFISQVMQGRCLATAIASWRSVIDNHGILLWQLNDIWPGVSWSIMEYDLNLKPSAYAVRGAFRDVTLSLRRNGDTLVVFVQAYSEYRGREVFGYLHARSFEWTSQTEQTHTILFAFRLDASEQEIARIDSRSSWRISGFAFVAGSDSTGVHVMHEWTLGSNRFDGLVNNESCQLSRKSLNVHHDVTNMLVLVKGSSLVEPYVWLELDSKLPGGVGYFEQNGFVLFPFETMSVRFVCLRSKLQCMTALLRVRVTSLRIALCS